MKRAQKLVRLSDFEEAPIRWLWADRIPLGAITLLEGDPGNSKSTLTYDLAARVTVGSPMPGSIDPTEPSGVVLLQAEDHLGQVTRPRLAAAGADLSRIRAYAKPDISGEALLIPNDIRVIEEAILECEAKLVVIDPFTAFLAVNANSEQGVRKALAPMVSMAEKLGVSVLAVRHLTKGGSGNAIYRGIGSIGLIAAARSALLIGPDPAADEPHHYVIAQTKTNLSRASSLSYRTIKRGETIAIEWLGESRHSAADVLGGVAADRSALGEAAYVLYSILADGPIEAREAIALAAKAGVSKRTLDRAKRALGVRVKKEGSGQGSRWLWSLAEDETLIRPYKDKDLDELTNRLLTETDLLDDRGNHGESHSPSQDWDGDEGDEPDEGAEWLSSQ